MSTYNTIAAPTEGKYTEKMSRFLAFAHPVATSAEAKDVVALYQNKYHDARHVCWAYIVGSARTDYMSNDNGEPSGTAGKPILGQINSFGRPLFRWHKTRHFRPYRSLPTGSPPRSRGCHGHRTQGHDHHNIHLPLSGDERCDAPHEILRYLGRKPDFRQFLRNDGIAAIGRQRRFQKPSPRH